MNQVPPPFPPQGPSPSLQFPQGQPPPGYPSQPAAYAAPTPIKPGHKWFWIGGATIVVGAVAAIAIGIIGFLNLFNVVDGFQDVRPDGGAVTLDRTGGYVIYSSGQFGTVPRVAMAGPDGDIVDLTRYVGDLTYNFNGDEGRAAYTFQADQAGVYQVVTDRPIAIGESIGGDLVRAILIPMAIGFATFILGLLIIIVTAIRRSSAKKRVATSR